MIRAAIALALLLLPALGPLALAAPAPTLAASLQGTTLARGDALSGTVSVTNPGPGPLDLAAVYLAARPPGGTRSGGPYLDVGSVADVLLPAGVTGTWSFSRTLGAGDPAGDWFAYPVLRTREGRWIDGAAVPFRVLPLSLRLELHGASVAPGATLSGTVTVENAGAAPLDLARVVLAGRPPGATNAGGPYLDFGGVRDVRLDPGARAAWTFTRAIAAQDPVGDWYAYPTARHAAGTWQDGARTPFTVAADGPAPTLLVALALTPREVRPGEAGTAVVTVRNLGEQAATLRAIALAATAESGPPLHLGSVPGGTLGGKSLRQWTIPWTAPSAATWSVSARAEHAGGATASVVVPLRSGDGVARAAEVRATPTGLTVDGAPYLVRGVAYTPVPVGETLERGYDWYADPSPWSADLALIQAMGANTLRVYGFGIGEEGRRAFLDAAHAHGLRVIAGDGVIWRQDAADPADQAAIRARVARMVDHAKDHPAVLLWLLGNEVEAGYPGDIRDWYRLLDSLAVDVHARDPRHPVTTAFTASEKFRDFPTHLPNVDVYSVNLYTMSARWILDAWVPLAAEKLPGKPVLISEFGSDAWDSDAGREYADLQATLVMRQWDQILMASTEGRAQFAGGVAFQFTDGWWKSGAPERQDGTPDWRHDGMAKHLPDGAFSREFMGLARIAPGTHERDLRPAYHALRERWG